METEIVKPEEDLISKAQQVADRIEKANQETKLLLDRAEKLRAFDLLGGKSEAGLRPKTQTELDQEAANKFLNRFKK